MRAGAALALALMETELVDADDARRGDDPTAFVQRSLARLWLPEGLGAFDYGYALEVLGDRLVFTVRVERGLGVDFTPAAAACDALHPRLGPALLTHLRLHTPLTPAFTPEVCRDYLAMFYWEGSDDAENLYYLARNDLAFERGVDEALVDEAEVRAFADAHYFTPVRVDALLERRYTVPGVLPLGRCLELLRGGGLENLARAAELLFALRVLAGRLPACDAELCADEGGYEPFASVVALPRPGDDLVDEVYAEYEESVWQGGAFNPVYALAVDPADPASLAAFGRALAVAQKSLELTGDLYRALEAACPRP